MRGRGAVRALVVLLLVLAPLAPFAAPLLVPADRPVDLMEERIADLPHRAVLGSDAVEPVDAEVLVTVKLEQGATMPDRHGLDVQRTYTRQGAGHVEGYVSMAAVRELSHDPRVEAVRIERASSSGSGSAVATGASTIGADRLHAAGVTGENVTVGVIDSGFRVSDPEIARSVGAYRSFSASTPAGRDHGTAVASVVVDTAPESRLHLAAVGDSTTPAEYREAVDWLRDSGADVVVDAGSYFGDDDHGEAIERVAENASRDVVYVVAAGNHARRHWTGTHNASNGTDWVAFGPASQGNLLADGEPIRGRVRANLRWTADGNATGGYDLYLLRVQAGRDAVVASSTDPTGTTEHLDATVTRGRYYLAIQPRNATGTHRLELFSTRRLTNHTGAGSLTVPATAPGVVTVGTSEDGAVAPFSSRGPVGNRTGVDLVAPDSVAAPGTDATGGTSYAAPYVAGSAALVVAEYPSLSTSEVEGVLRSSAVDVGAPGVDPAAGYGRVDAPAALRLARDNARYRAVNESS